ncbi:hypothetical protein PHISCL_03489 [Aspergillus sclerotialis]|uniref:DUF6546 domain-containing protein n=1 Tax=Aspergillus sclerotialis TaxID=2070753 RepID=A0A3A2ZNI0_9EURO|nr:hypothetical protein PHISCL_03489 [Aspergillus sclerotialis]
MSADKTPWYYLPAEIRILILETLLQDGCSLASFATVSREWQTIIERHNFARIKLTPSRLINFDVMIHRNRALVRYIWLCIEFEEYDCDLCVPQLEMMGISNQDDTLTFIAILDLFSTLSTWEPNGNLLLDISVYSPSDSEYWFKYLTFEPDIASDECDLDQCLEQSILNKLDDHQHGWVAGSQYSVPPGSAIHKVFFEIMSEELFGDKQEDQWLELLPLVPVVTGVLLRQQSRRRWKPTTLALMFVRLPSLKEIYYEPWMEWHDDYQTWTDQSYTSLFKSLASRELQKLVVFENFNQQYPLSDDMFGCPSSRIPNSYVIRAVANASLNLEHLSASFIVDSSYFFDNCEPSWKWSRLVSLTLTSRLLTPHESTIEVDNMLREAASAAIKMPKLEILEIWNRQEGLAPAVITWRGTWEFVLQPAVVQAWEAVAFKRGGNGSTIVKELLDSTIIKSHGDATHHLRLLNPVIRPVSLRQIRMEHRARMGEYKW